MRAFAGVAASSLVLGKAGIALVLLAAAGGGAPARDPATEVIVAVSASQFDPAVVEIRRGVLLTFHSLADLPGGLVVVAADGSFESRRLDLHGEWSHRFGEAGTFEFSVKRHPGTSGRAIVR